MCVLFFGTVYATGIALYRYFGDTEGYTVVSANAGQHMPLLFLIAGGALAGVHGTKVYGGAVPVFDWLMLAIGLGLLVISVWGLYCATVLIESFIDGSTDRGTIDLPRVPEVGGSSPLATSLRARR